MDEASEEIKNRRKKRAIKVAITETLMVLSIIILVTATTFLAVGYNIDFGGEEISIERTGLVQVQTIPTGANLTLDGNGVFGWTNLSRSMAVGSHEIVLSKDGYDSWKKEISVSPGLYYRLSYPRLFLLEKKVEEIADFSEMSLASFAKDGNLLLTAPKDSVIWQMWRINEETPMMTKLDLTGILPEKIKTDILVKSWSGNSEKVLVFVNNEWILIDVKRPKESVNLTKKFGTEFSEVKIANDSASELYVLENGNLRAIDVSEGVISEVLISNVANFDNLKSDVVYATNFDKTGAMQTGIYRKGEKGGTILSQMMKANPEDANQILVTIGEYYGEYYVVEAVDEAIGVYKGGKLPSYGDELEMDAIFVEEIGFLPEKLETTGGGELITASRGIERATFDVEIMDVVKITTLSDAKWLDEHMLYEISDGKLEVMDFDGENKREMMDDSLSGTEVKISKNNRWMYLLNDEKQLVRIVIN